QDAILYVGVGKILMAYNLSLVFDTWGTAPYTEAFNKVETLTPKYDSPEQLYDTIGRLLDEGIAALQRPDATYALDASLDVIDWGDVDKGIRSADGLKARHLNKLSRKASYNPQGVLDALGQSFQSADDDMGMAVFEGINPWAQISKDNINTLLGGWL